MTKGLLKRLVESLNEFPNKGGISDAHTQL